VVVEEVGADMHSCMHERTHAWSRDPVPVVTPAASVAFLLLLGVCAWASPGWTHGVDCGCVVFAFKRLKQIIAINCLGGCGRWDGYGTSSGS